MAFSTYVLNLRTAEASFISGTIIGTILGTILRYFLYRFWVYGSHRNQVSKGEGTDHEELGRMFDDAAAILDGEASEGSMAQSGGANASGTERGR